MPIYEYRCAACGHHTDALQKMSDAPLRKCPECGKSKLQRLVSAPQFRLKGGGWYETDFKGGSEKKRNLVEKGGEDSGASAKSDSGADTAAKEAAPAADTPKPATPKPETARRAAAKKKAPPKARAAKSSRK
jgi:putative FmdB family regulatory protein